MTGTERVSVVLGVGVPSDGEMVGLADGESFVSDPEIEREEGCVSEARIRTDADRSKEVVAVPVLAESV